MKSFTEEYILEAVGSEETIRLYDEYHKLYMKRRMWAKRGKDTTELDKQLATAKAAWMASKQADKNGGTINQTPVQTTQPTPKSQEDPEIDKNSADYKAGYEAAMKAMEEIMKGKNPNQDSQGNGSNDSGSGNDESNQLAPFPDDVQRQAAKNARKSQQQNTGGNAGSNGGSRTDSKNPNQGVVRPQDCMDPSRQMQNCPGNAGGMISKDAGDDIAKAEGYDKEGGNQSAVDREWQERSEKARQAMRGEGAGYDKLAVKIATFSKPSKDWKRELKNILGRAISPEDTRSAYANKNILISQDRLARTDKAKYDAMSYMMVWIDTSGSMTNEMLQQILCDVYSIALVKKPLKLVIWMYDTRVAGEYEYTNVQQLQRDLKSGKLVLKGGGGTDVKCCEKKMKSDRKYQRNKAEIVLIFTDGYDDQVKRDPRTMNNLCYVIIDNPNWDIQYKDSHTRAIYVSKSDF